jgi:hypothetical protein
MLDGCQYELINNDNILFYNILKHVNLECLIYCCPKHKIYHICYGNDCILVDGQCYFSQNKITTSPLLWGKKNHRVIKFHHTFPFKTPIIKQLMHKFSRPIFTTQLDAYLQENNLKIGKKRFNSIAQNLHDYITQYIYSKFNKQHTNLELCMQKMDFIMQSIFYSFLDQKIPTTYTRNRIFKEINILISKNLNCPEKDLSQQFDICFEDLYIIRRRQKYYYGNNRFRRFCRQQYTNNNNNS